MHEQHLPAKVARLEQPGRRKEAEGTFNTGQRRRRRPVFGDAAIPLHHALLADPRRRIDRNLAAGGSLGAPQGVLVRSGARRRLTPLPAQPHRRTHGLKLEAQLGCNGARGAAVETAMLDDIDDGFLRHPGELGDIGGAQRAASHLAPERHGIKQAWRGFTKIDSPLRQSDTGRLQQRQDTIEFLGSEGPLSGQTAA